VLLWTKKKVQQKDYDYIYGHTRTKEFMQVSTNSHDFPTTYVCYIEVKDSTTINIDTRVDTLLLTNLQFAAAVGWKFLPNREMGEQLATS
jgi:hypothetical protein